MCAASVNYKKLLQVNNHPIAENSPNLVTLVWPHSWQLFHKLISSLCQAGLPDDIFSNKKSRFR
jgi:hypothetical protein